MAFRDATGTNPYANNRRLTPLEQGFSILGTIMGQNAKQRNEAGIAKALEGIGQPAVEQGGLLSSAVQMPDKNFAPQLGEQAQQPTAQNIGVQQLGAMQPQPENTQQKMSGLLGNTQFDTRTPEQQQQATTQQQQFSQAVQANPEWYRQGVDPASKVYVGDRPDLASNATVTASGKAVDLTPSPVTSSNASTQSTQAYAPVKTEIAKNYKQQAAAAMMELVSKRGMSARDARLLVDAEVAKKTEEDFNNKAEEYAQNMDKQLEPYMGMDFQTSGNKVKFLGFLAKYNSGMKRIGREGADLSLMRDIMGQGDITMQKEDNGAAYRYVMVKKNGERFDDGSFQKAVPGNAGEWTNKVASPEAQLSASVAMRGQDMSRANTLASIAARGSGGGSGGSLSNKMSMYKWASAYSLQPTGEIDVMGKPVMTRVQNNPQLAAQLSGELGYSGQGGGQGGEDPRIAQARAMGYSEEEIQQYINGGSTPQQPQQQEKSFFQPTEMTDFMKYGMAGR